MWSKQTYREGEQRQTDGVPKEKSQEVRTNVVPGEELGGRESRVVSEYKKGRESAKKKEGDGGVREDAVIHEQRYSNEQ